MQADLRAASRAREVRAALGEAVAKINHDLRNMLSSAQIASERLAMLGDPRVTQALPRLERALDRAITLASDVLNYGKSAEAAPQIAVAPLLPALAAAAEDAGLSEEGVRLETSIGPSEQVTADPDQLHRILVNLLRNAREAVESAGTSHAGVVTASLEPRGDDSVIRLSDNGPGVPERAIPALFKPFAGSARAGGAGLGLAISRELAQAHGGDLVLIRSGPDGTVFELTLPNAPAASAAGHTASAPAAAPLSSSAPRPRGADPRRPPAPRRAP